MPRKHGLLRFEPGPGISAVKDANGSESPEPSDGLSPSGDPGPYRILRNRNYVLYLLGRFIASIGNQMLNVAVGWELYERTGSALALGFVGVAQIVPMFLFNLPAGHWADHYPRQKIMIWMTGVHIITSVGLTLVSALQAPVYWMYVCLFLAGTSRTFFWPASASFLPQLVGDADFPRAVAWSTGSFHLSSVAGPAVAGAWIALTHRASDIFTFNVGATLVCLILVSLVRCRETPISRQPMTLESLITGFRFVWASRIILGTLTLDLFAVLLGGATALLPIYAKDILHAGPSGLGYLQAALPLGSLLSSIIMAHLPPLEKAGRALLCSVVVFGFATIVFGMAKVLWLAWLALFVCGLADNVSVVIRHTLVQVLTPDDKRGRVSAVNSLFIGTSNELGGFESGLVAHYFGPVFSAISGGVGTILVVGLIAVAWPEIRRYGRLTGPNRRS